VPDIAALLRDLSEEAQSLDAVVAPLSSADWRRATPAPGWTIAHQIAHLAWSEEAAHLAVTQPERFAHELRQPVATAYSQGRQPVDEAAVQGAAAKPAEILARWRAGRAALADALRVHGASGGGRIPWFGPPMSAASMATARLMETWAHGQDVVDALGVVREPTARLRHVAHLGVRTRDFSYAVNQLPTPAEEFRVELASPDEGRVWVWAPDDAAQRVRGPALDFCLLVTQRRHRADLAVVAEGPDADQWLDLAQAFAVPPGAGRTQGQFA
jgi:uncharacterized protein (TIGR03084 family)